MTIETQTPIPLPTATPQPIINIIIFDYIIPIVTIVIGLIIFFVVFKIIYIKYLKNRLSNKKDNNLMYEDFNVGRYFIIMFRQIGGKYHEIDRLKIEINQSTFRYNNKDFSNVDLEKIAFTDKRNNYYAFDYDNGTQLFFSKQEIPNSVTIDEIDIYVNRNLISQLVAGLEPPKGKGQYLMLIVGAVLGVGIGIVIGQFIGGNVEILLGVI